MPYRPRLFSLKLFLILSLNKTNTPQNIAAAIQTSNAAAVDVSGGVESAGGIKDEAKMAAFIQAVRAIR